MTTSTLYQLNELRPESRFDERRFRMNVILGTPENGFIENDWLGHGLEIGDDVRLTVSIPDPRCVMTTLPQGELPKDTEILRTLVRHNRIDVAAGSTPARASTRPLRHPARYERATQPFSTDPSAGSVPVNECCVVAFCRTSSLCRAFTEGARGSPGQP
jgi:hypothetical protein